MNIFTRIKNACISEEKRVASFLKKHKSEIGLFIKYADIAFKALKGPQKMEELVKHFLEVLDKNKIIDKYTPNMDLADYSPLVVKTIEDYGQSVYNQIKGETTNG